MTTPKHAQELPLAMVRKIIKVVPDHSHPVGQVCDYLFKGDAPPGWRFAEGAVFTRAEHPQLFAVIGRNYIIRAGGESWLQRWARRVFRLKGPEAGLREDEGRLPDFRPHVPKTWGQMVVVHNARERQR